MATQILAGASESILIHRHGFCSLCIYSVVEQPSEDLVRAPQFKFPSSPGSLAAHLMGGRKRRVSFASSGKQVMRPTLKLEFGPPSVG
jgi:hypothetical protein